MSRDASPARDEIRTPDRAQTGWRIKIIEIAPRTFRFYYLDGRLNSIALERKMIALNERYHPHNLDVLEKLTEPSVTNPATREAILNMSLLWPLEIVGGYAVPGLPHFEIEAPCSHSGDIWVIRVCFTVRDFIGSHQSPDDGRIRWWGTERVRPATAAGIAASKRGYPNAKRL